MLKTHSRIEKRLDLLHNLNKNKCKSIRNLTSKFNVNSIFGTILTKENIIRKNNITKMYDWISAESPSYSLALKLYNKEKEYNNKYKKSSIEKQMAAKETPAVNNNSNENIITINMDTGIISTHISSFVNIFDQIKRMGIKF